MEFLAENLQEHVKLLDPNDKVSRAECIYSYDTPDSENGLYIDMNSFKAVGKPFLTYHHNKYGHNVYLHHRRLKIKLDKPSCSVEDPPKRLAIGLEGGFNPDAPDKDFVYEDNYSIFLMPSETVISLSKVDLPDFLQLAANLIIVAPVDEVLPEKDTNIWDGETKKESSFAKDLYQISPAPVVPSSDWKCEKCDKTDNLWLNLTDGSILCGRKFFDGSGGNNHAVEHFKEVKHPLAVKLGTITRDGADVYSYPEEDMVIDPCLSMHLAHFGIDIEKMSKTDKSMIELEIDMNQKIGEWSIIQEEGAELVPISGPGFIGLVNLGNSCYMNSVLQVLMSFDCFEVYYEPPESIYYICNGPEEFLFQMAKLNYGLKTNRYTELGKISPKSFKRYVCSSSAIFSTKLQQDVHEFLLFLLDKVEMNSKVKGASQNSRNDSVLPSDYLKLQLEERLECSESKKVKYSNRIEYCLPLSIDLSLATNTDELSEYEKRISEITDEKERSEVLKPKPKIPLWSCLEQSVKPEIIDDFLSPATKSRTTASKTTKIQRFPKILALQMKKFLIGPDWVPKKMDIALDVPEFMELDQFLATGKQEHEELMEDNSQVSACQSSSSSGITFEPDSEAVANMLAMGIDIDQAVSALKVCDNDAQRAIEYIFDPSSQQDGSNSLQGEVGSFSAERLPAPPSPDTSCGTKLYQLKAFISHMGTSTMNGHYVCHIRKGDTWYIYNDDKVAISQKPPREFGYLYFYEKIA